MRNLFVAYGGPMPTTAALAPVSTGTAIKTLMQIATPSTKSLYVVEWGISFDGVTPTNAPIKCELIDTAAIAATVTAYVAADVIKLNRPSDEATAMTLGTSASGYNASAEGTIVATRPLDVQYINPTGGYIKQFPLGSEPEVAVSRFLRVRVTAASGSVNAYPYVVWAE
jgi:hypothetical protein